MAKPKVQSPLLGYNTNVRHLGELFHIQTEDSGVGHPHVITHLFAEGTILATKKTSYADHLQKENLEDVIRQLMKDQHKSMFVELRDGVHDATTQKTLGYWDDGSAEADMHPSPASPSPASPAQEPTPATAQTPPAEESGVRVIVPAGKEAADQDTVIDADHAPTPSVAGRSIFDTPDEDGEFGDGLITDKSLDEVILSYLTEDLDE